MVGCITDSMDMSLSKLGDGEGQGSLACYSPWGREESDMTVRLNNNKLQHKDSLNTQGHILPVSPVPIPLPLTSSPTK